MNLEKTKTISPNKQIKAFSKIWRCPAKIKVYSKLKIVHLNLDTCFCPRVYVEFKKDSTTIHNLGNKLYCLPFIRDLESLVEELKETTFVKLHTN